MHAGLCGTELCSVLDPTGGLERCVQLWAKELAKYCRVTLIDLAEQKVDAAPQLSIKDVDYVVCGDIDKLPELLLELKIDVVQLQNRPLVKTGLPTLVTFHNYPYAWSQNENTDRELLRVALHDRYITAVSAALLKESISLIGHGNIKNFLLRPPIAEEFFAEKHLGGNGLLFASRLMRKKGVEIAVNAVKMAGMTNKSTFLDTTTPFLKHSPEYLEMKKLILDAGINLAPAVRGAQEMAKLYAAADAVLHISLENEGLGLIPLEAQAVGANVIAAGPGGLVETVLGPNLYFAEISPEKIAEGIFGFLTRPIPCRPPGIKEYDPVVSGKRLFTIMKTLFTQQSKN
jgi:glycosyltransferase involved in cell wall biosynthesis